jgi:hypothetical protein
MRRTVVQTDEARHQPEVSAETQTGVTSKVHPLKYQHDDGNCTRFSLQVVEQPGHKPSFVMSEDPGNTGPGIRSISRDMASGMMQVHGLEHHELAWYEQRGDGNFDRVHFRTFGHDPNRGLSEGGQPQLVWDEYRRETYTPAQVRREIGAEPYAQPLPAQKPHVVEALSTPAPVDRDAAKSEYSAHETPGSLPEEQHNPLRDLRAPSTSWNNFTPPPKTAEDQRPAQEQEQQIRF